MGVSWLLELIVMVAMDSNSGYVRVYKNTSGTWTQIGSDIDGEKGDDHSGYSVSLSSDGSIVAIGAPYNRRQWTKCGTCKSV